jgi:hypothetical protein
MKRFTLSKNCSDEALNAGKEVEAMKRLKLHRIVSSLLLPALLSRTLNYLRPFKTMLNYLCHLAITAFELAEIFSKQ